MYRAVSTAQNRKFTAEHAVMNPILSCRLRLGSKSFSAESQAEERGGERGRQSTIEALDRACVHFNAFTIASEPCCILAMVRGKRQPPIAIIRRSPYRDQIVHVGCRLAHVKVCLKVCWIIVLVATQSCRQMTPSMVSQDIVATGRKHKQLFGTAMSGEVHGTRYFMPSLFRNTASSEQLRPLRRALMPARLRCE